MSTPIRLPLSQRQADASEAVFTVGVGKWRGGTLSELEAELARVRARHDAPDDAKVARTAPGSTYAFELIWIGKAPLTP